MTKPAAMATPNSRLVASIVALTHPCKQKVLGQWIHTTRTCTLGKSTDHIPGYLGEVDRNTVEKVDKLDLTAVHHIWPLCTTARIR